MYLLKGNIAQELLKEFPSKSWNDRTLRRLLKTRSSAGDDKPTRRVWRSVKVTKLGTIRYVRYGFLLVFYRIFVPTSSSLKITNRSFRSFLHLWNQLPVSLRQPCTKHSADNVTLSNSSPTCSPLSPSITHSLFHSRLKTHLFHKSFPS